MAVVVKRVVIVVGEIPADQVVFITVAVPINAIGPARILQKVARVDIAVLVDV